MLLDRCAQSTETSTEAAAANACVIGALKKRPAMRDRAASPQHNHLPQEMGSDETVTQSATRYFRYVT